MKNFLVTIRDKWAEYLLELLVIIIGILSAFSLNNWNEERKQEDREIKLLQRLVVDLSNDTAYYHKRISKNQSASINLKEYLQESYKIQESAKEVTTLLRKTYVDTDDLNTHNSTYRELTSTGQLSLIKNEDLKNSITNYYRLNEEYASNIKEFNSTTTQLMIETLSSTPALKYAAATHPDSKVYPVEEWQFINNIISKEFQVLESQVTFFRIRVDEHLGYFQELKSHSSNLISMIESELSARD